MQLEGPFLGKKYNTFVDLDHSVKRNDFQILQIVREIPVDVASFLDVTSSDCTTFIPGF